MTIQQHLERHTIKLTYLSSFKDIYNYDDLDESDFDHPRVIEAIYDSIDDCESDGLTLSKEEMAKVVKDALYHVQYGDTTDADELERINEDIKNRFPDGR